MPTRIHQKPFPLYLEVVPRTPLIVKSVVVHCTLAIRHFYTLFHSIILIIWAEIYRLEIVIKTYRRNKDSYVTMMTEFIQLVY